ncbi:VanZ family protein [Microbacterium sp. cf332]|uniref:VanZ family protein n=1 Tax=Microbacterium sp. cf332 TaxID=1761804 RepID=UPI00088B5553|nr:VanZ family protein [Microbacterium sp. cf332]SDQ89420.1 Glycopeptide antibiotics resistance protein [Microbacterium sp. cf332]
MSDPFGEVPVLPVVVPLGLVVFVILLVTLSARRRLTLPRMAVAAALAVYAAGIVGNTVFPIFLDKPDSGGPWTPGLSLLPFVDYEVEDALTNMLVFVPLGILIPLLLARPTWLKVVGAAALTSLGVESAQLAAQAFFAGGHIADINDFLSNVAGGAIGYGVLTLLARVPVLSRLIDPFRWSPRGATEPAESTSIRG